MDSPTPNPQRGEFVLVSQPGIHSVTWLVSKLITLVSVLLVLSRGKVEIMGVLHSALNVLLPRKVIVCL